ncbi:MAG: bacillithiol biosynthesis deacetylase BshB1 [Saprospiraceae bacterium]|nr:bacillithiol biosynthesis deacetylase BshB1 [Saprospiraceae bacterium]
MKVDILAIGVHPDDIELSCSGTLIRYIKAGKKVGLLDLTRGELGTRGTAEIRDQESRTAAKMMGALFRENLQMADGFFQNNPENVRKIIEVIRYCQPEIVLANAPKDRHPDHGRASKLTHDACFYAGLSKIETQWRDGQKQQKWRPRCLYHYIQDFNLKPDFVIDISNVIDQKMEVIKAYRSQFHIPEASEYAQEEQTPISGADFMAFLKAKSSSYGREAGYDFGEGYITSRTPGLRDLFELD